MKLRIDTTNPDLVTLILSGAQKTATHTFQTNRNLSEKLVLELKKFLARQKIALRQISQLEVAQGTGHFSRVRTAVATANALIFGIKLKQRLIVPVFSRPLTILGHEIK